MNNEPIGMDDFVIFIQIVNTSKLVKDKTSKFEQWKALERSINGILPLKYSRIKVYKLLSSDELNLIPSLVEEFFK